MCWRSKNTRKSGNSPPPTESTSAHNFKTITPNSDVSLLLTAMMVALVTILPRLLRFLHLHRTLPLTLAHSCTTWCDRGAESKWKKNFQQVTSSLSPAVLKLPPCSAYGRHEKKHHSNRKKKITAPSSSFWHLAFVFQREIPAQIRQIPPQSGNAQRCDNPEYEQARSWYGFWLPASSLLTHTPRDRWIETAIWQANVLAEHRLTAALLLAGWLEKQSSSSSVDGREKEQAPLLTKNDVSWRDSHTQEHPRASVSDVPCGVF